MTEISRVHSGRPQEPTIWTVVIMTEWTQTSKGRLRDLTETFLDMDSEWQVHVGTCHSVKRLNGEQITTHLQVDAANTGRVSDLVMVDCFQACI